MGENDQVDYEKPSKSRGLAYIDSNVQAGENGEKNPGFGESGQLLKRESFS